MTLNAVLLLIYLSIFSANSMKKMKKSMLLFCLLVTISCAFAQDASVLFIGNSYTGVNNLPNLTFLVANSVGDSLAYDAHTPGGARFLNHAADGAMSLTVHVRDLSYIKVSFSAIFLSSIGRTPSWDGNSIWVHHVFAFAFLIYSHRN